MEKIRWIDRVKNEGILHRITDERNTLYVTERRKDKRSGHILRRNSLLRHLIEGKIF